jgi:6-phosphogluconolactonase (cycloisomerase 2 family)
MGLTVGGTVTGLHGTVGLLSYVYADPTYVSADGTFKIDEGFVSGRLYDVQVVLQPVNQHCVVHDGKGQVGTTNVTDVSVVCVDIDSLAVVVNAADATVSTYSIDAGTGALAPVGMAVSTGPAPRAIATESHGGYVYVANGGSSDISGYVVDPVSGALTSIPGSPFATGAMPQAVAIDPQGEFLYVANNGSNDLWVYFVNASGGRLSPWYAPYTTGNGPSAVAVDPSGKFVYVANSGSNDISAYAIDQGRLAPVAGSPFASGGNPHGLAFGASGRYLYTANLTGRNSTVSGFGIDPVSGALTMLDGSPYPVAVDHAMATDRGGAYLYVTVGGNVVGYGIDDATGALSALAGFPVAAGANAYSVTFDRTNQFLYVGNDGDATVTGFTFHMLTGSLNPIPGSPFAAGNSPDFLGTL